MMAKNNHELRATYGDGRSRKVAEGSAEALQRKVQEELRPRRRTGSSTFYSVQEKR